MKKINKNVFVYRGHGHLHRKSKGINKKLLEPISNYSNFVECKVNVQKSIHFLCTSNEQVQF